MRESIKKYFKVGLVEYMAYPAGIKGDDPDILKRIKQIACDDYFDAIELTWIKCAETRRQAAELLKQSHMTVCYAAQPVLHTNDLNVNHLDESERQKAEAALFTAIDEAYSLGAKGIAFLSGKWEEVSKEESYSQLLKTTRRLCDYANKKNMFIELEVFDFDIAKASLIGPAPLAARFAADMRTSHSNFGLLIDLSHIPLTYETPAFVIKTLRPYITHFHIGNAVMNPSATGYGDEHPRFGFPDGVIDVPELLEFLRVLKCEGFLDADNPYVLSFEVKPFDGEDPDIVVANAKRALNRAWALL